MVKGKWENVIKPSSDRRSYRVVECNNELKAVLISDPQADKAAVAMTVQVGSSADPDELQGLAHFLEHMLFLGSEKYPAENDYKKFLTEHGGAANASTSLNKTTFYLTVAPEHLGEAMDRFSQFFICPLMNPEATDREVNAVSLECERNRKIDRRRLMRLERWLSKPGHPYQRFSTGNKKLLDTDPRYKGVNVRNELLNFHEKWYSANLMTLAVISTESLDDLEDKVGAFFSDIKNKNVEPQFFNEHPYQKDETAIIYYTSPIKNRSTLTLMFPCCDYSDKYTCGPVEYVKYILECCSKGSLYAFLRSNFLIDGQIEAGLQVITKGMGKFYIRLRVTENGLSSFEEIVGVVFQFLNTLRMNGPQKRIFEDVAKIAEINFEYRETSTPQATVINLSEKLSLVPYEDILVSDHKLIEWDPQVINDLLSYLNPSNVRIRLVGKKFENMLHDEDPIYGIKYKVVKINETLMTQWQSGEVRKDMTLPEANCMIPNDFALVPREYPIAKKPSIIFDSKLTRLWYLNDNEFLLPKAFFSLMYHCPTTFDSPLASNLTFLVLSTMEDVIIQENWQAHAAGTSMKIEKTQYGFQFVLSGFSQKILSYVDSIMKIGTTLRFTAQDLSMRKDILRKTLMNKEFDTPVLQSDYLLRLVTKDKKWTTSELMQCIDDITVNNLEHFYNKLTVDIFTEGLVYGNVTKKDSEECWVRNKETLTRAMNVLSPNQMRPGREIVLPVNVNLLYEKSEDVHTSSCTTAYFHLGTYSFYTAAVAELFYQYTKEPIFTVLRTKEQLAYKVYRGVDRTLSCLGFYVRLLTDKHPRYVDDRIEVLLNILGPNVANMSESDFETHKQSLISDKLANSKKMTQKYDEMLEEIRNRHYVFDRQDKEIAVIRSLTKGNLLDFYNEYIKPSGARRRRLSIFILSSAGEFGPPIYAENPQSMAYQEIQDTVDFKNECYAFPLLYVTKPQKSQEY